MENNYIKYAEKIAKQINDIVAADWNDAKILADILDYDVDDIIEDVKNNSHRFCMTEMSMCLSEIKSDLMQYILKSDISTNIETINAIKKIILDCSNTISICTIDFAG